MSGWFVQQRDRTRIDAFVADYRRSSYAADDAGEPLPIVPSPIDERMARDHESLLGISLPPLFRAYLLSRSLPDTDLYVGQLPPITPGRPLEYVERWSIEKMDQPFYRRNERLVPFSHGPADCSDLCFDAYRPTPSGDYPIIKIWHLGMDAGPAGWADRDCQRTQAFDTFADYLDYLHHWLIFKAADPGGMFDDWLRASGKKVPPSHYGLPY